MNSMIQEMIVYRTPEGTIPRLKHFEALFKQEIEPYIHTNLNDLFDNLRKRYSFKYIQEIIDSTRGYSTGVPSIYSRLNTAFKDYKQNHSQTDAEIQTLYSIFEQERDFREAIEQEQRAQKQAGIQQRRQQREANDLAALSAVQIRYNSQLKASPLKMETLDTKISEEDRARGFRMINTKDWDTCLSALSLKGALDSIDKDWLATPIEILRVKMKLVKYMAKNPIAARKSMQQYNKLQHQLAITNAEYSARDSRQAYIPLSSIGRIHKITQDEFTQSVLEQYAKLKEDQHFKPDPKDELYFYKTLIEKSYRSGKGCPPALKAALAIINDPSITDDSVKLRYATMHINQFIKPGSSPVVSMFQGEPSSNRDKVKEICDKIFAKESWDVGLGGSKINVFNSDGKIRYDVAVPKTIALIVAEMDKAIKAGPKVDWHQTSLNIENIINKSDKKGFWCKLFGTRSDKTQKFYDELKSELRSFRESQQKQWAPSDGVSSPKLPAPK